MGVFVVMVCGLCVVVFGHAVQHKIFESKRFQAALLAYKIVPTKLVPAVSWLLVICEVVACIGLLLIEPVAVLLAGLLLLAYLVAMGINIARGRSQIECGCGDEPTPLSFMVLGRNAVLILLLLSVFYTGPVTLTTASIVVGVASAVVASIVYFAVEQLIRNKGTHQRLWLGVS